MQESLAIEVALEPLARLECFIVCSTSEGNVAARTDRSPEGETTHTRRVICTERLLIQPGSRTPGIAADDDPSNTPSPPLGQFPSTLLDYTPSSPPRPSLLFHQEILSLSLVSSPGISKTARGVQQLGSMGGDRFGSFAANETLANQFPPRVFHRCSKPDPLGTLISPRRIDPRELKA